MNKINKWINVEAAVEHLTKSHIQSMLKYARKYLSTSEKSLILKLQELLVKSNIIILEK